MRPSQKRRAQSERALTGRGQEGTTVAEMVIVTALLSLVLATAFAVITSLQRASQGTTERGINLSEGRLLLQQSTKDLRTATRLTSDTSTFLKAAPTEAVFYANLKNDNTNPEVGPRKVRIYVDTSKRLVEEVTAPDTTSVAPNYTYTGAAKVRFVGQYITNGATNPPFTYFSEDATVPLAMDPSCTCLNGANRLNVRAVGVTFSIRHSTSLKVAPTTLVNRVRLPNLDYNDEEDTTP